MRLFLQLAALGGILCVVGAVILTEGSTSLPKSSRLWQIDPSAEEATVTATDGAILRGACFRPSGPIRGAVIVLHGVGDHGHSMTGLARLLTRQGYIVLVPDSRAHGGSGGDRITYGLLERTDVVSWLNWIDVRFHPPAYYGYGASLGGGILIQSLEIEPRFRAIIAECPFADFHTVAYDRLSEMAPKILTAPFIETAFLYTRLRYGLNLYAASPENVLRRSHTPTLLIHGTDDRNIPIEHSRRLHASNPATTELWEIEHATHVNAWARAGTAFETRVIDWFEKH